jgi:DNA mismatch endonuclease (patch repair protein)
LVGLSDRGVHLAAFGKFQGIVVVDRISPERRSQNMSLIKSRDTKPEIQVRSLIHRLGYRFRIHRDDLPGTPDIVLPRYRLAVFVHGCFWHRHQNCKYAYCPKSRIEFWNRKFVANVQRDTIAAKKLKKLGWRVVVIWECQLKSPNRLKTRLSKFLASL